MDKNLLLAEKDKLKLAQISNKVVRDGSYQERDHYALDQLKYHLLDSLVQLTQSAPSGQKTDILTPIAKDYLQQITSLATFAPEIKHLLSEFNALTLKHSHNTSQSILLALIVRRMTQKNVILLTEQHKIKKNCMIFHREDEVDTVNYTKHCLQRETVRIIAYEHDLGKQLSEAIQEQAIVILDVFGLEPPQYYLHLSRNFQSCQKAQKVIIYHSLFQQKEIDDLMNKIQKQSGPFNSIQIELAPAHPVQFQGHKQRQELIEAIIFFIRSIAHYAQKQDLIVFYPLDQTLQQFVRAFKEKMVKASLKDCINIITTNHQSIDSQRSNIFFAHTNSQLEEWDYSYRKVYMVIDYGFEEVYAFDYELGCHVQSIVYQSHLQKLKRITRVGSDRCGCYHYLQSKIRQTNSYLDYYPDISKFLLECIASKQLYLIDLTHWRVVKCLTYLQELAIIKKDQDTAYSVIDQRYIIYTQKGIAPAQTKLMLSIFDDSQLLDKNKQKYLNLMAMALCSLRNCGDLRKVKQSVEGSHIKPYAVWRKSGYLQSCLEIITKCELIQLRKHPHNSKSQQFRRKTSKAIQSHDMFTKHYSKRSKKFEEMQISDLIQEYSINEPLLLAIRDCIDEFRSIFEFEMVPILLEREAMAKIMLYLAKSSPKASFALYTGSKATEYFNGKGNISMHQTCLFNILNQRPETIQILRLHRAEGQKQILMANSISKQHYIDVFGTLPVYERSVAVRSQAVKEQQHSEEVIPEVATSFKFQDIPSAVFEQLLKNNGETIESFQYDNNCHLYLFSEIGQIVINCFKDEIENKQYVWQNLNIILKKISQGCRYYTKKLHYMGIVQLIIKQGAQVLEIVDSDQISRCLVTKLPPEIAKEYVEVVLEGFPIKNIEIIEPDQFNLYHSAVIEFYSKKSFKQFLQHYQNNLKNDNFFEMKPIKDSEYYSICNKDDEKFRFGQTSTTLLFRWYTWKSLCKAQVKFKNPKAAKITLEAFQANPYLDSVAIKLEIDSFNPCLVNMSGLKPHTDQIYIAEALKDYGTVESVEILKTPLKQTLGDAQHIGHLLKVGANTDDQIVYQIISMEKKQFGLRQAKVAIPQKHRIRMICERLNKRTNLFGEGRLYVEPIYQKQILVPYGCLEIYTELFEQMMEDYKKQRQKIRTEIREDQQAQSLYIVLITSVQQTLFFVLSRFRQKLNGVKIDFPAQARNVILNEIGIANFLDMEQKFNCKFVVSAYSGKIKVLAKKQRLPSIYKEIQERLDNHFFYKVTLTSKLYKHYQEHKEILERLQKDFELLLTELEEDNWALLLEGNAVNIQKAVNYLHQKDKDKNEQKNLSQDHLCGICGMRLEQSYRLFCSHRFCKECLVVYIRYGLSDMSQFPLKCPELECRELINCSDLQCLLEFEDWTKIRTLSVNQFLKKNDSFSYCLTAGCEQVNRIQHGNINKVASEFIRCDICKNSYCIECGNAYHPARTCSEAKMSQDELLKNYIKDQGVRKCSGKRCKALVVRDTGCYKVQCTRCGICMCFKCPADNMMAFETPTECYDHLNNVHGGYF